GFVRSIEAWKPDLVVCTHLDEGTGADSVRQEQVRAIIREWDFSPSPIIVAGDLNATPETIEIRLLNEAGLDDLGAPAGVTTTMSDPQKRIDYIWGKGVVGSQAHTPATLEAAVRASDHRWLAVNITWEK
ncbi:MAG: endonuclease/exonuclease/phosphatase family protein, partial [Chloroflexota bacterium]